MKKRKIPMRKSVVSGEMKPKKELVRITRSKEGEVALDPTGKLPGRALTLIWILRKSKKLGIKKFLIVS